MKLLLFRVIYFQNIHPPRQPHIFPALAIDARFPSDPQLSLYCTCKHTDKIDEIWPRYNRVQVLEGKEKQKQETTNQNTKTTPKHSSLKSQLACCPKQPFALFFYGVAKKKIQWLGNHFPWGISITLKWRHCCSEKL